MKQFNLLLLLIVLSLAASGQNLPDTIFLKSGVVVPCKIRDIDADRVFYQVWNVDRLSPEGHYRRADVEYAYWNDRYHFSQPNERSKALESRIPDLKINNYYRKSQTTWGLVLVGSLTIIGSHLVMESQANNLNDLNDVEATLDLAKVMNYAGWGLITVAAINQLSALRYSRKNLVVTPTSIAVKIE